MNRVKRRLSTVALAIVAIVVAVTGVLLATGSAAVVVTHGVSMQPLYTEGDLVVVARAPSYTEGDIAAYRQAEDDSVVLHRIVGGDAAAFTFQGDNNASIDPETPDVGRIVGRAVIHIPQGGIWLERLSSPPVLAIITFLLLTSGGAAATTRIKRRKRSQAMSQHNARIRPTPIIQDLTISLKALAASALVLVVSAIALGAYAWAGPLTQTTSTSAESSRMEFGYSARVEPGPVYDGTKVSAPDAIFLNVVDTIELDYAYIGDPGTLTLEAELSAEGGWRQSVPLADPAKVSGEGGKQTVTLKLNEFNDRAQAAAAVTGIPAASVNIAVTPAVRTAAGAEFRPVLNLALTPLRLSLAGSSADLVITGAETEADSVTVPRPLGPSNWNITAGVGRTVSVIMAAAGLLLLAGIALLARRQPVLTEADRIRKRYSSLLVEVKPLSVPDAMPVAEVHDFAALARLAEQFSLPVLTWSEAGGRVFLVRDEGVSYRYRLGGAPAPELRTPAESSISAASQP